MAKKVTKHSWLHDPDQKQSHLVWLHPILPSKHSWLHDPDQKQQLNCSDEIEELEKFHEADQMPIKPSEKFKSDLKEELWKILKNKYYIVFALSIFFFG